MGKKKSKKKLESEKNDTINKVIAYRRTLRDIENSIKYDTLTEDELETARANVNKLRMASSNKENEYFRDSSKGLYLGLSINLLDGSKNDITPLYFDWNKITNHVGVLGASGVGKTILMLSNIKDTIDKGWSTIIVDPKGGNGQEIVNSTFSFCKDKNIIDNTYYLSPALPENSFFINPLFGMNNIEIATTIRDLMMGEKTEQFYGDITYKTVLAIITCFDFIEKVNDPDGTIATKEIEEENDRHQMYMMLNSFINKTIDGINEGAINNLNEPENTMLESIDKIVAKRTLVTFRDLAKEVSHEKLTDLKNTVEQVFIDEKSPIKKRLEKMKNEALFIIEDTLKQEKEFFSKVSTSLSTILTKLSAGSIGDIFCTTRTNPMAAKLGKENAEQFVLIIQPFSLRFGDIANTVIKLVLKQLNTLFGNVGSTERIINRTAIFLDEGGVTLFADSQDMFNKSRSLGGTIFIYTQSFADFTDSVGKEKAKIIIDNINTTVRMRVNDIESAERIVKELSKTKEFSSTTVASTSTSDSKVIIQKNEEDVLNPTDVTLMPVGRGIVKYDGDVYLVDFAHYGKVYSDIKFKTNKYFEIIDSQGY